MRAADTFGNFQLCARGGTVFGNGGATDIGKIDLGVLTAANSATLQPFNPFTQTPVEGVHWAKRTNFGTGRPVLVDDAVDVPQEHWG